MSNTSPIAIITDTDRLSAVADAILARAGNPNLTKNTVLNAMAGALVGSKTNWGGLKAMTSPVRATALSDDTLSDAAVLLLDDEEEQAPYSLAKTGLVLGFYHPVAHNEVPVSVEAYEIPAIQAALFGRDATGEYHAKAVTFENAAHGQIVATSRLYDGVQAELSFDAATFGRHIAENHAAILDLIVNDDGLGDALHSAYIAVGQDQGEEMLFDIVQAYPAIEDIVHQENSQANSQRIDAACREAVWIFLAAMAEHGDRRKVAQYGQQNELVDVILDHEWSTLGDAIEKAFEAERHI